VQQTNNAHEPRILTSTQDLLEHLARLTTELRQLNPLTNYVLDSHPVHRSKAVKAFAASTNGRLRLCFLPGYAPELNPDEWVWKHVKHDRIGRAGVTSPDDLKAKALAALHQLQKLPYLVQSFFQDPNLRYITA
jgi:transposase